MFDNNSFDKESMHIYDTTLRDGAQQEGLNLSVHDKLTIARHLDDLGVGFIEGGWPEQTLKTLNSSHLPRKSSSLRTPLS
jgi:2-isopropylmalate synthase